MGKETTYGVWAVRSGASIFGHAEAWCKDCLLYTSDAADD